MIVPSFKAIGFVAFTLAGVSLVGFISASVAASWVDAVAPLIGAVAAAIGTLLTIRQRQSENRLAKVEQADRDRHLWVDQIQEQLDNEIKNSTELRILFNRMYRLLLNYHYGTARLVEQVAALGLEPAWRPPSDAEVEALLNGGLSDGNHTDSSDG